MQYCITNYENTVINKSLRPPPSIVARGCGGRGGCAPPHWHVDRMGKYYVWEKKKNRMGKREKQNGENTTFLALLRLFYALEWTK